MDFSAESFYKDDIDDQTEVPVVTKGQDLLAAKLRTTSPVIMQLQTLWEKYEKTLLFDVDSFMEQHRAAMLLDDFSKLVQSEVQATDEQLCIR